MWPIVTDVPCSVCLLEIAVSPTKTDELIEIPFGVWTQVGPRNHALGENPDCPDEWVIF